MSTIDTVVDYSSERYNVLTPEAFANGPPHEIFDELRAHDPMHEGFSAEGRRVWSLTRYADIRDVSGNPKLFSSSFGPVFVGPRMDNIVNEAMIMSQDAPYHTRLRHFLNLGFSPRVTRHFEPWIREIVAEIVASVREQDGPFDFLQLVSGRLPAKVVGAILGVPKEDQDKMLPWAQTILRNTETTAEAREASHNQIRELFEYARAIRAYKAVNPADDMISMLATAEYEGEPMTELEFDKFILTAIAAGLETTFTGMSQSSLVLIRDPDLHADFRDNHAEIMDTALDEILRYVTPTMQMSRTALEDTEIHGRQVAKEDEVVMWYTAANRDPAIITGNPHQIDLRRKNRIHATFGAGGPHFCIGNLLAKLQIRILFEELFKANIWFELAGEPVRMKSVLINGLREMPVRLVAGGKH